MPVVIPNPPVVSPAAGHELSTLQTRAAELKAAISAYAADPTLANLSLLDSARSDYDTAVTAARNANPAAFFNNAASTSLGPATSRYLALAANHAAFIASEPASLTFEGFIPNGGLDGGVISMGSGSLLDLRGGLNPDNSYSLVFDDNLSYDDILLNNMVAPFAIATSYGGAIFDQGGTLSLNQVLFTNNSAYANTNINGVNNSGNASGTTGTESYGGAIYSLGGTINLSNIDFYSNDASGGSTAKGTAAGYIATAMALSQGYGGAIYLDSGFMSIGNSSFSFNAAFAYSEASAYNAAQAAGLAQGGAIFHKGGKVALHDVTFTQNSATADITSNSINSSADAEANGGAIYQGTGTLSLRQVTFTGNEANAEATARNGNEATASTNTNSYAIGGAIFNKGGVLNLFNVDFSTNKALSSSLSYAEKDSSANAESRGGAFYNDSGTLAFTNGSFLNNVASANADNNAHAHGGAFYTKDGTLDLFNVTFSGNYAQAYSESFVEEFNPVTADSRNSAFGGAIYSKDSAFNLTNVSISNNYAKAEASATANGSYYSFPIASAYSETLAHGGAAYHEGGAMSFSNASFSSNYARAVSDSIAYGDTGIATDVDSVAFAYARGGAIYHNGGLLSLSNATFSNNYAYASASASASMDVSANIEARAFAYGGAIFTSGATLNLTNVTFSNNHVEAVGTTSAEARGGAIYSLNNAINFTTSSGKTSLFTGNTANGVASSIYFNGGSFDILTQTNALLDMRDPMSRENTVSNLPITKTGDGAWALGGSNTFLGNNTAFAVNGGTLYLYAANEVDNSVRDINGDIVTAAQVVAGSLQLTGASSSFSLGSGASLVAGGTNSITTGGTITFADGSTIRGGSASQFLGGVDPARKELGNTTQLTLSATGGISLNGTVNLGALDAVDVFTLTGLLTGSGGINKVGAGTVVLANANTFLGNSSISAGTLRVTNASGSATGSASLAVKNGSTLAGNGKVTGVVTVENGGTISPGLSPGTISLGELVLGPSGHVAFELGTPNVIGGPTNDLIDVVQNLEGSGSSGNLTLNGGIVDILSLGGLGTYTLIAWDGGLVHNATPTIGLWQAGYFFDGGIVVNETLKEVQLTVTTDGLQFWDGNGTSADGILTGGTGTWNFTDARWTDSDGSGANLTWQDGYGAVFGGLRGGTVTLNDNVSLGVQGLHFATSGYTLTGTGAFTISDSGT
ncbi:MAG: beta strand repeat-containing protein, partial [Verrucomicrobium sp.]